MAALRTVLVDKDYKEINAWQKICFVKYANLGILAPNEPCIVFFREKRKSVTTTKLK